MPDVLALAAALLARGVKPPVYVDTLAGYFALFGVSGRETPPPHVLSPQLARFLESLEKKHAKGDPK